MKEALFYVVAAAYFAAGILTFAYVGQRACTPEIKHCDAFMIGYISGVAWPLYWAGAGAIYLTRPAS